MGELPKWIHTQKKQERGKERDRESRSYRCNIYSARQCNMACNIISHLFKHSTFQPIQRYLPIHVLYVIVQLVWFTSIKFAMRAHFMIICNMCNSFNYCGMAWLDGWRQWWLWRRGQPRQRPKYPTQSSNRNSKEIMVITLITFNYAKYWLMGRPVQKAQQQRLQPRRQLK